MPAAHRETAAHARVDRELAEWLTAQGRPCTPSRVAGWRAAGLLPAPTGTAARAGDHAGRVPAAWTDAELADARRIALRLVNSTGRGTSTVATALRLAGEGVPIPPATVLIAARDCLRQLAREVRAEFRLNPEVALDPEGDPQAIADIVEDYVRSRPRLQGAIARRLRGAPLDPDGADAQSVVTLVAAAALGVGPDPGDVDALRLALRAFGLDGLADPVGGAGGPRVLAGGPGDAGEALGQFGLPQLERLLGEIHLADVHPALQVMGELGRAFAAVPAAGAHHLAADLIAPLLLDNHPAAVVLRLLCWQALRHLPGGEAAIRLIIDAIRAQGWLPPAG